MHESNPLNGFATQKGRAADGVFAAGGNDAVELLRQRVSDHIRHATSAAEASEAGLFWAEGEVAAKAVEHIADDSGARASGRFGRCRR